MVKRKYNTTSHTKYLCQYHIIWCPKFRYKVLFHDVKIKLEEVLHKVADRYHYDILELEIMPDHVHIFVAAKPTVSPIDIVRTMKSISAVELFKEFPKLKQFYSRCGVLWSRGKFISTIGKVSEETIRRYIREQDKT